MKDKSDAMPGKVSSAWARASLGKHAIAAKENKAKRCIAFPPQRQTP
jgi:hypothetical protein